LLPGATIPPDFGEAGLPGHPAPFLFLPPCSFYWWLTCCSHLDNMRAFQVTCGTELSELSGSDSYPTATLHDWRQAFPAGSAATFLCCGSRPCWTTAGAERWKVTWTWMVAAPARCVYLATGRGRFCKRDGSHTVPTLSRRCAYSLRFPDAACASKLPPPFDLAGVVYLCRRMLLGGMLAAMLRASLPVQLLTPFPAVRSVRISFDISSWFPNIVWWHSCVPYYGRGSSHGV